MTQLHDWDQELDVVAREIEQVKAAHARTHMTGNTGLIAKKIAIVQTQIGLERTLTRLRKVTQREFMLLPRERAMIHWGAMYVEAATRHFALKSKLATRYLWLRLVRTRMADPTRMKDEDGDVDQEDLVSLAVRQANLAKTEGFLAEALTKLTDRKRDLTRRYHALGVVDANHVAGGSLATRLGPTPDDALRSPVVRSLEAYFRLVTAPVTSSLATERFAHATTRAAGKTDGLMGLCRTLAVARTRDPAARAAPKVLDKFQRALEQLADLEAETREAYGQILGASLPATPDDQVQNPPEQAKTVPNQ